jgi:hypothetical protein
MEGEISFFVALLLGVGGFELKKLKGFIIKLLKKCPQSSWKKQNVCILSGNRRPL